MLTDTLSSPGNVRPLRQGKVNSAELGVGQQTEGDQIQWTVSTTRKKVQGKLPWAVSAARNG